MHVPIESAREARSEARRLGADCAVAIGAGPRPAWASHRVGVAGRQSLPILAIPTTYAGSEMTPIYGLTRVASRRPGTTCGSCHARDL